MIDYIEIRFVNAQKHFVSKLKLLPHDLGVAYRGPSLVCYSVTEYKSACRVVYAIPLSHISDIRELAMAFLLLTNNYISKATLNIHGKVLCTLSA